YVVPQLNVYTNSLMTILSTTSEYEYFEKFLMIKEHYSITFPTNFTVMNCYNLRYSLGT
ncbi:hypothetical protein BgiBS90_019242, partial [Biomphalaria glabrata]